MNDRDVWLELAVAGAGGGALRTWQLEHHATFQSNPISAAMEEMWMAKAGQQASPHREGIRGHRVGDSVLKIILNF